MQPASHRDSHTHPDSAQTQHTPSIATKSAPYTRHITTSALALQSVHAGSFLRIVAYPFHYLVTTWRVYGEPVRGAAHAAHVTAAVSPCVESKYFTAVA